MYDVIEFVFKYITFGVGIYFLFGTDNIGWSLYIGFTVLLFMALYLGIIGSMKEQEANFTLMYTAGGVGIYFLLGTDSFLWNVYLILTPLCIVFLISQLIGEQQKIKTEITNLEPDESPSKKEVEGAKEIVQQKTHIQNGEIIEELDPKNSQIQPHKKTEYEFTREKEEQEVLELQLQLQEKAEWGTNYQKQLANSIKDNQMCLDTVYNISKQEVLKYHKTIQDELHKKLKRGVTIIKDRAELFMYMFAYGRMHQRKLNESIEVTLVYHKQSLIMKNIEIIDYGCGQGIGTICFLEQLKKHDILCFVQAVTLIEPSEITLKRSVLHVYYMLQTLPFFKLGWNSNYDLIEMIRPISKYLPSSPHPHLGIVERDIYTDSDNLKIHIFSNILDMDIINLRELCGLLNDTQSGNNICICVSPREEGRLRAFFEYFQANRGAQLISQRNTNILNPSNGKPWGRVEQIFYF